MAIDDVDTVKSPAWWIKRLGHEMTERRYNPHWTHKGRREGRPPLEVLDDYFSGEPPLPSMASGWKRGFKDLLRMSRMNFAEMSIESTRERMVPRGISTGADDENDADGDSVAERIFGENDFPLLFTDLAQHFLVKGDGYAITGQPNGSPVGSVPRITVQDPKNTITADDPATGEALAGLQVYRDDWDERDIALLYLPNGDVMRLYNESRHSSIGSKRWNFDPSEWTHDEDGSGNVGAPVMPLVRFSNLLGKGEFEPHLDVLDRINNQILDRVTVSKIQAFRQRAIRGLPNTYPAGHAKAGQPIDYEDIFVSDPGALWKIPTGVDFWESGTVDLSPIRMAIKDDVEYFAAATRTPLWLITPDAANGTAEGASLQRESKTYQVEDRRRRTTSGITRLFSSAFAIMGDQERSVRSRISVLWEPAERYSLSQKGVATSQMAAAGIPMEIIASEVLQMTPGQIADLMQKKRAQAMFEQAMTEASAALGSGPGQASTVPAPNQVTTSADTTR